MAFASINPATGQTLAEFPELTAPELEARLARAADAVWPWRFTAVEERAAVVARLGELLDAEKERLGRIMTLEMGKPIRAAVEEAAKCAMACRFYAEHGPGFIADERVTDADHRSFVAFEPLGVVLAVMPWNFPFWQVVRFLAPALVAGNVGLLKHASNVPQCALELESLVRRAGEMGDQLPGLQARLMSQALRKLTGNIKRTNTLVVFINQIRSGRKYR